MGTVAAQVDSTVRSPGNAERVRALGAEPIALDLLDPPAVRKAVFETGPDAIVHQATALAGVRFSRNLDRSFAQTNRLRTEGTDALLAAAREAGVHRFVAQSFASARYARDGGWVKTEEDPLDPTPPAGARETNDAMRYLDQAVTEAGGIALCYGGARAQARRSWHLQRRRRRTRPVARMVASARPGARRQAAPPRPPVARSFGRRRGRRRDGNPIPRRFQREGQTRARLDAPLPSWRQGFVAAYASTSPTDRPGQSPA